MDYSPAFYKTIKQFVYTRLYIEYRLISQHCKKNQVIWQKIFNKFHNIVKYLCELRTKIELQQIRENTNLCYFPDKPTFEKENSYLYSIPTSSAFYSNTSFQEYVNAHINMMKISVDKSISIVEYNKFIRNMQDKHFKQTVFEKYEQTQYENEMKNEMISKILSKKRYHNEINLRPYFEYISKNGQILEEPNPDNTQDKYRYYENYTLWLIHKHL